MQQHMIQLGGYSISVTADGGLYAETPANREIYIESLISQNRNSIDEIQIDGVSIPDGSSVNLVKGETYEIKLIGSTATQGYNQFESFINLRNTIFQIMSVSSSYNVGEAYVDLNNLYADACGWEIDTTNPDYLSCAGSNNKAGGAPTIVTYQIKILESDSFTPEMLTTLLYDYSGSSFHYNSDYDASVIYANIIDPELFEFQKIFSPAQINIGETSTLTFTISNPNSVQVEGFSFSDSFPSGMRVAYPLAISTSGCGTPTFSPNVDDTIISFSDGTISAGGSCTISIDVISSTSGTLENTSSTLKFINQGVLYDTTLVASDSIIVNAPTPTPSLTPTLLPTPTSTSQPPLTSCEIITQMESWMNMYDLTTIEDYYTSSEVEGRSYIMGNFTGDSSSQYAIHLYGIQADDVSLTVAGQFGSGSPINVSNGSVVVGPSNTVVGNTINGRNINLNHPGGGATISVDGALPTTSIENILKQSSTIISQLTSNNSVSYPSSQPGPVVF